MNAHTPPGTERAFWNAWNVSREQNRGRVSTDQQRVVLGWLEAMDRRDLRMIDIGCGAGWLCESLLPFGRVTGTDLSDEVLSRTAARVPQAEFVAGDFMALPFEPESFDVAVSLEVLSHVPDQPAFLAKIASLLKPDGVLMLATQNRPVLMQNDVPAPKPGQRRRWVDRHELQDLLAPMFFTEELFSVTPKYNRGPLRIVNSDKAARIFDKAGLSGVMSAVIRAQEKNWMGWTLMALARKR
jgi:2-polyprenyl-3-methyl-5-hydroxy-6-metoxy-1,4-benzoquinol methylase